MCLRFRTEIYFSKSECNFGLSDGVSETFDLSNNVFANPGSSEQRIFFYVCVSQNFPGL